MQTIVRYHPSSFPKGAGKTAIYVHAPQNSLQILMAVINTANFTEACLWWAKLPDQAVKRWAPTAVSCEVATHPSHCWDATAYPVKGKGRSAELCCHVHATVCKRKATLLKQCSSVCAKSHPTSFQILSWKILPENSSYKPLLSSLGHVSGRQCTPSNNPSHAPGQLLDSSIYLLSKFRHRFPSSGPAEVWKLCFTRLMVGKV